MNKVVKELLDWESNVKDQDLLDQRVSSLKPSSFCKVDGPRKCTVQDLSRGPRAATVVDPKSQKRLVKNMWAERRLKSGGGTLYFRGRSHSNLLKP